MENIKKNIIEDHLVFYDKYHYDIKPELRNFFKSQKFKDILKGIKKEIIVILGGDGTLLKVIPEYYDKNIAFLPINFGTVGFLLNDKEWIVTNTEFIERKYPILDVTINILGKIHKLIAFNELTIKDIKCKLHHFNILVGKSKLSYSGDGLLVATPAGSTGSNSGYYGPVLPHKSNDFIITYICPHYPDRKKPTVVGDDKKIIIENKDRMYPLIISADGNTSITTNEGQQAKITIKKSKCTITLLISKEHQDAWDNKGLSKQGFTS